MSRHRRRFRIATGILAAGCCAFYLGFAAVLFVNQRVAEAEHITADGWFATPIALDPDLMNTALVVVAMVAPPLIWFFGWLAALARTNLRPAGILCWMVAVSAALAGALATSPVVFVVLHIVSTVIAVVVAILLVLSVTGMVRDITALRAEDALSRPSDSDGTPGRVRWP
ncbi:hypothetical protein FLP10_11590 [Agromyces intestinalis]|uniref:Uncharacterized protein n=1 Tax=Agromyces intestinalis TaxID=2592652 RepID=A0A5C1YHD8_9MICO|nr:hypothetical protein [Agromyces intestinalis]QEO14985.1 hypothetical protein FLP10_11590 [Agromyces intestinalis]